jgi:small ubiquitin-related modifier
MNALKFLFDGQRVHADQTPKQLEMDDNDQIDVMLMQEGGNV